MTDKDRENAIKYNLKYAVKQRYFTGKVEAWIETCNPNCRDSFEEYDSYDFYFTVFDNEQDAKKFQQECLVA